ncbi:ABC transporter substrate-binding protein [Photobacterium profundum]|uniref:ABC transporter substrate-binding protein n=1 Tax=Photobacterium profundum TaxID=74109 RepID=UPI003D105F75
MIRLLLLLLILSPTCFATPTNHLIILTTFSEASITPVTNKFQQLYPDSTIKILHRRADSGVRLLSKNDHDIDLVISSSPALFLPLVKKGTLKPLPTAINQTQLQPTDLKTHSDDIAIFGYSAYGLMWNNNYLTKHNLDQPKDFKSLIEPQYFRHLIMSSPARSSTMHLMVENILQQHGWKGGWKMLLQMGGNLASISARSFGVSDAISRGLVGIGPVIDSFAFENKQRFPFIGFTYQLDSPLMPSYIAAVKNLHQANHTSHFIDFLLSDNMQKKLPESSLYKYPLNSEITQTFISQSLDFKLMQHRDVVVKHLFEQAIAHQLTLLNQAWQLINEAAKCSSHFTNEQHRQYDLAISLASTPPVTEAQAHSDIYTHLSLSRNDIVTTRQLNAWQRIMRSQLEQSIAISQKIIFEHEGH